jgi:hypothetical protein
VRNLPQTLSANPNGRIWKTVSMEKLTATICAATLAADALSAALALADTYNDLGPQTGENNGYWNTTGRAAVPVSVCASDSAVPLDGWSRTMSESEPRLISSYPAVGLAIIFR